MRLFPPFSTGSRCTVIFVLVLVVAVLASGRKVLADSSSTLLAAYYDRHMAIVRGVAYGWEDEEPPRRIASNAAQVGVGRRFYYVLDNNGILRRFRDALRPAEIVGTGVASFAAGRTGVLTIDRVSTLWWIGADMGKSERIAENVAAAAVGDGTNYYVTRARALFVKGLAHRGQYGDGRLRETDGFVQTATGVTRVFAHTGHALTLTQTGDVMGTGGNIYGPVGRYGLGDKAVRWSRLLTGATGVATGASHSAAVLGDGALMVWGAGYGPDPVRLMGGVSAVAAGSSATLVLKRDGSLWQVGRGRRDARRLALK